MFSSSADIETHLFCNFSNTKVKGKIHPQTVYEGLEGSGGITLSSASVLGGGGWPVPHPSRFTPGKENWYPLYRRLVGPQDCSGQVWKILSPPGFNPGLSSLCKLAVLTMLFKPMTSIISTIINCCCSSSSSL